MVYSTCTLNAHENEEAVARILALYPCLELLPQAPRLGSPVCRSVATAACQARIRRNDG
jgi:16S rRNA C967 or C1407 C5-methylase (RsmB/RsmF family)